MRKARPPSDDAKHPLLDAIRRHGELHSIVADASRDLSSTTVLRLGSVWIGERWLFAAGPPRLFRLDELVWAYRERSITRIYFVPIESESLVILDRKGDSYRPRLKRYQVPGAFKWIADRSKNAFLGYDRELAMIAKKDFDALVRLADEKRRAARAS